MTTKNYVAGLMFSKSRTLLALVRKNRPEWQAGKLNAIGGKIENLESPLDAMVREFREETGVLATAADWQHVVVLQGPEFVVHFFAAFSDAVMLCRTTTDEEIVLESVKNVLSSQFGWGAAKYDDLIPNLRVIIPLALDDTGIAKPVILRDDRRNPETGSPNDR